MKKYQLENALITIKSIENLMHLFDYDVDTQKTIKTLIEHQLHELNIILDINSRSHIDTKSTEQKIQCLTKILEII
jgi:hypothetical protein